MTTDTYLLELKPCADPYHRNHGITREPIYRLKRLLKYAARECGFRIDWGRTSSPAEDPMIRFADGPAAEQLLMLRRAPLFLRVVFDTGNQQWDALDQLADRPAAGEAIWVYRREGEPNVCRLDWTVKGRRVGGRFASATYRVVAEQPDDATMRDTQLWRQWCWDQVKAEPQRTK